MEAAFTWKSYSVSRSAKAPLLEFVVQALRMRGCHVLFASEPNNAPFFVVFETPTGIRQGVLVYAFFANSKDTLGRPTDEHRFQIKYGSDLRTTMELAFDPHKLITTIFIGIDLEREFFVAADPRINSPAPMSRSIEFKAAHVDHIIHAGWAAWERDRRPPKTKHREAFLDEDLRTEVLVGGRQDRLLDLISLEQLAFGLDPGERHLLADKLFSPPSSEVLLPHALLGELGVGADELMDIISGASRLRMAVRGWVAEAHLQDLLSALPEVSECRKPKDGDADLSLRWNGGPPILVECKNSLRTRYADGRPKVDFQRTRASKGDPCSRYYKPSDFQVLAACLHAVTERWEFQFALTRELPLHDTCAGRIRNMLAVEAPVFTDRPELVFDKCSRM